MSCVSSRMDLLLSSFCFVLACLGVAGAAPTVTGLDATEDSTNGGTWVTITGTGFAYPASGGIKVLFGGVESAQVLVSSETSLISVTPAHAAGTVDVTVINPDGQSGTLTGGFAYVEAPPPSPSSVNPAQDLTLGGSPLAIYGSGFVSAANGAGSSRVFFGGVEATEVSPNVSGGTIECKAPPHAAGTVDVVVLNRDGKTGTIANGFTYLTTMTPTITGITPATGYAVGGTSVRLSGTNFSGGGTTRVTFGGVDALSVNVWNGNGTLYVGCLAPPHAPGVVDVTLHNPCGTMTTLPGGFTYTLGPPPFIDRVTPGDGAAAGGTRVFLSGYRFATLALPRVTFGGVDATEIAVLSSSVLACAAPPHSAGTVDVAVTNPDGQSSAKAAGFTYRAPATAVVRVDVDNVSGTEDGATWATAFSSIQAGVNAASAAGQAGEVWVAEGTYLGAGDVIVTMVPFCDLYGGFAGTEDTRAERNVQAHPCIIDGEDQRTCVYGADNARLDGFTVTRGNGPAQPATAALFLTYIQNIGSYTDGYHLLAMDNAQASPSIVNCTFSGNTSGCAVISNFTVGYGLHASPLITGCTIESNGGSAYGVLNYGADAAVCVSRISDCSFRNNFIGIMNAAMGGQCLPTVSGCVFSANTQMGISTAATFGSLCKPRLENCLFTGHTNHTLYVGSGIDLVNCTLAGNPSASQVFTIGSGFGSSTITNCIVWGNGGGVPAAVPLLTLSHCDVQGGYPGTGNIDTDPLFVDAAGGNFQLQPASPCVDAGTASGASAVDLLGVTRPKGDGYDMGAYEMAVTVSVPDLAGKSEADARAELAVAGLRAGTVTQQCTDQLPAGFVISQFPAADTQAVAQSHVAFVVSAGPCPKVPVAGMGGLALLAAALGVTAFRRHHC